MQKDTSITIPIKLTEIQLSYHNPISKSDRVHLKSSQDVLPVARQLIPTGTLELKVECFALLLNNANELLGHYHLSSGNTFSSQVSAAHLLTCACKANAVGTMLILNHPSGQLVPSKTTIDLAYAIMYSLKLARIKLLDLVILNQEDYYSASDSGLIEALEKDCRFNKPNLIKSYRFGKS